MFSNRKPQMGLFLFLLLMGLSGFSGVARAAEPCHDSVEAERRYTICSFDLAVSQLRLFWAAHDGTPYGSYATLARELKNSGDTLIFAMNAGMFHPDRSPVGLYIEAGRKIRPVNTKTGPGNFHMKPNGIFYFGDKSAGIMESARFLKFGIQPQYATQSGPLLVASGIFHP